MTLNSISTSRVFKYSSVLVLVLLISFAYFLGYQAQSGYVLHFTTEANHLAIEKISWNVDGVAETTRKESMFSVDSVMREHQTPIAKGKYSLFTINCYSPTGEKNTECMVKNMYISDMVGARVFSFDNNKFISNVMMLPVDMVLNGNLSVLAGIFQFILHMSPVYLMLFIFLSIGYKKGMPLSIWFCIMFTYAMIVFPTVNTGTDSIESINVARYLFSPPHYYSYVEYRGYMWFFILWLVNFTANLVHIDFYYCYAIYGCLIFTILLNYLLPNFAKNIGILKVSYYNVILLGCSIIFLYGKQFFCPLPDILPIFFLLLGLSFLSYKPLPWTFLAGVCIAISCLVRANYYLSVLFILIFIIFSLPKRFLTIILFLIPILFLSVTDKVLTKNLPGSIDSSVTMKAILFNGMNVQKTSPFEIKDKTGIRILEKEHLKWYMELPPAKYLELVKKYPIDFLTMYSIRAFNGLDIKYPQVYASEAGDRRVFTIINFILIFSGIYYLYNYLRYARWQTDIYLLAVTLPSLVMVASFVETRYFLPLSLVLVTLGVLSINVKVLKNKGFIFGLILFVICCLTISASVYNQVS